MIHDLHASGNEVADVVSRPPSRGGRRRPRSSRRPCRSACHPPRPGPDLPASPAMSPRRRGFVLRSVAGRRCTTVGRLTRTAFDKRFRLHRGGGVRAQRRRDFATPFEQRGDQYGHIGSVLCAPSSTTTSDRRRRQRSSSTSELTTAAPSAEKTERSSGRSRAAKRSVHRAADVRRAPDWRWIERFMPKLPCSFNL